MLCRAVAAAVLSLPLPALAADPGVLIEAFRSGDTGVVTAFVEDYYRDAGISVNDTLTWELQSFSEPLSWYNDFTEVILLSALPRPHEVEAYWQNWSALLTGERWNWRVFFDSGDEAALLAGFNQFVLAAHEFGHALTYRYDPHHERRHDWSVNCREYFADRLAVALLQDVGAANTALEALRGRYRELLVAIEAEIDSSFRYAVPAVAALEEDCRILDVPQPVDPETTIRYAAAFFARQVPLHAADLPSLATLYEAHLIPRWRERQLPPDPRVGSLTTIETLPDLDLALVERGDDVAWRTAGFDTDGAVRVLEALVGGEAGELVLELRYEDAAGEGEDLPVVRFGLPGVDGTHAKLLRVVPLGTGHFLALIGDTLALSGDAVVVEARRDASGWQVEAITPMPGTEISSPVLIAAPDGAALFFTLPSAGYERRRVDIGVGPLRAGTPSPAAYAETPIAVTMDGATLSLVRRPRTIAIGGGDAVRALAGNGLQGFKDAAIATEGEIVGVAAATVRPGAVRFLDYDPRARAYAVREMKLGE